MFSKVVRARFYQTPAGTMPVRDWLLDIPVQDRKATGEAIRLVEFGWPLGMPVCRSMNGYPGLWEIRVRLEGGRAARILFAIEDGEMLLLHGFFKTSEKTPDREIALAMKRWKGLN